VIRPAPAGRGAAPRCAAAAVSLLVVLLPALLAGLELAAPPTLGERQLLAEALDPASAAARGPVAGAVARAFATATAPSGHAALPEALPQLVELVAAARRAQVAALVAISGLLYAVVRRSRSQLQALASCLCLAALPPVAQAGHWLRAETPAVLFGLFALLFGCELARAARRPPLPGAAARWGRRLCLGAAVLACALALALAVAACPVRPVLLLWPGVVLALGAVWFFARTVPLVRRRGWLRLPIHAGNGRLLPWTALSLLAPLLAAAVLAAGGQGSADGAPFGLVPGAVGLCGPPVGVAVGWWLLVGCGVGAWAWRAGLQLGRTGRITADLVGLVYAALGLLFAGFAPAALDRLPAAPAAALSAAEGLLALLRWGAFAVARWGRR
jgi:hypothetical protein